MKALELFLSQPMVLRLGWTLVHFIWQAALIAVVAAIVLKCVKKQAATLRYTITSLSLVMVVTAGVITFTQVTVSTPLPKMTSQPAFAIEQAEVVSDPFIPPETQPERTSTPPTFSWPAIKKRCISLTEPAIPFVVMGWLAGVFGLSLLHLGGWAQLRKIRQQLSLPVSQDLQQRARDIALRLGVHKAFEVFESALVQVPAAFGHLKPVILLPAQAITGLSSEQIEIILAHELAHIKRCDYLINLLQTCIETLGFYHPAVWWLSHSIRQERENCCDDMVVNAFNNPVDYAKTLADMALIRSQQIDLAVASNGSSLVQRIERLAPANARHNPKPTWLATGLSLTLVLSIAIQTTLGFTAKILPMAAPGDESSASLKKEANDRNVDAGMKTMQVRVVDSNGMPIQGVNIHRSVWTKVPFQANADFLTNESGKVSVNLPESMYILRLWATKNGHVPLFVNFDSRTMGGPDFPKEFTFTLARGTTIGGFVVDESGEPIVEAKVEVSIDSRESDGRGETVVSRWLATEEDGCMTDKRGYWSLNNVPEGSNRTITLWLTHPGYVDDMRWRRFGNGSHFTIKPLRDRIAKLVMEKGIKVKGIVIDENDTPIPDAMVVWGDDPYGNRGSHETFTDETGQYQLPPLAALPTVITVVAPGSAPQLKPINPDGSSLTVDFQLTQGKTVRFNFVDTDGKSVPGVQVNIGGWRGRKTLFNMRHPTISDSRIPNRADDTGTYVWDWAPEDKVGFQFYRDGYQWIKTRDYGPGTHQITLQRETAR